MDISEIKKNNESKMDQSIAAFNNSLSKIRTGRANPGLLDNILVEYYGNPTPLSQVANVSLLDARTIMGRGRTRSRAWLDLMQKILATASEDFAKKIRRKTG